MVVPEREGIGVVVPEGGSLIPGDSCRDSVTRVVGGVVLIAGVGGVVWGAWLCLFCFYGDWPVPFVLFRVADLVWGRLCLLLCVQTFSGRAAAVCMTGDIALPGWRVGCSTLWDFDGLTVFLVLFHVDRR